MSPFSSIYSDVSLVAREVEVYGNSMITRKSCTEWIQLGCLVDLDGTFNPKLLGACFPRLRGYGVLSWGWDVSDLVHLHIINWTDMF